MNNFAWHDDLPLMHPHVGLQAVASVGPFLDDQAVQQ
jgi:hypothetical protein